MKKLVCLISIVMMIISLSGCKKEKGNEEPVISGLSNPVTEVNTLEDLNGECNTSILKPAVMGISDERYSYIEMGTYRIAQYQFKVNGYEYTFRTAQTSEDISGIYVDEKTAFEAGETDYVKTKELKAIRWFNSNGQFVLAVYDNGDMKEEQFRNIADEFIALSEAYFEISEYDELSGSYTEEVSLNAQAKVYSNGDNATVEVSLRNDDSSVCTWTMTIAYNQSGKLGYSDMIKTLDTYNEDGSLKECNVIDAIEYGYFTLQNGKLIWEGSNDPDTVEWVFAKK